MGHLCTTPLTGWDSARESVRHLATLQPNLVVTGHGRAMQGPQMRSALNQLALDFDSVAVPKQGGYVDRDQTPRAIVKADDPEPLGQSNEPVIVVRAE